MPLLPLCAFMVWRRQPLALPHDSVPSVVSFKVASCKRLEGDRMVCFPSSQTPFFLLSLCLPDRSSLIFLVHDVCQCLWVCRPSANSTWPRVTSTNTASRHSWNICATQRLETVVGIHVYTIFHRFKSRLCWQIYHGFPQSLRAHVETPQSRPPWLPSIAKR
jgi:hypothetical protein